MATFGLFDPEAPFPSVFDPDAVVQGQFDPEVADNFILVAGIASAEAFGTPQVNQGITGTGIASSEAFGTLKISLSVASTGIASAQAFGTPSVVLRVAPTGISSAQAFGSLSLKLAIAPSGIASGESFGTLRLALVVTPSGIVTEEAFGNPGAVLFLSPAEIGSAEAFGTPTVSVVTITVIAGAMATSDAALWLMDSSEAASLTRMDIAVGELWAMDASDSASLAEMAVTDEQVWLMDLGGTVATYPQGAVVKCSVTISRADTGAAVDPSTLTFTMNPPSGTQIKYTYGVDAQLVRDALGKYHVEVDTSPAAGSWLGRWASTGTGQAQKSVSFDVTAS